MPWNKKTKKKRKYATGGELVTRKPKMEVPEQIMLSGNPDDLINYVEAYDYSLGTIDRPNLYNYQVGPKMNRNPLNRINPANVRGAGAVRAYGGRRYSWGGPWSVKKKDQPTIPSSFTENNPYYGTQIVGTEGRSYVTNAKNSPDDSAKGTSLVTGMDNPGQMSRPEDAPVEYGNRLNTAMQVTSALTGPIAQGIAAKQYNMPDLTMEFPRLEAPEVDFSREESQIQEDTRTFDRGVNQMTRSTPLAAAMMTARRAQANRQRAQLAQTRENMNANLRFQTESANQQVAIQEEQARQYQRSEQAKFENERTQKFVDSLQQAGQNLAMMARERKMDMRDKARFRMQMSGSSPEAQNWMIFNAMEGATDSDIRELSDITGYSVPRLKAMYRVLKERGANTLYQEASNSYKTTNFDPSNLFNKQEAD